MIFEIFRNRTKEFHWRIKSRNGKIEGGSVDGFKRYAGALRFYNKLRQMCLDGRLGAIKLVDKTKK